MSKVIGHINTIFYSLNSLWLGISIAKISQIINWGGNISFPFEKAKKYKADYKPKYLKPSRRL
jgi:hypothetical protein